MTAAPAQTLSDRVCAAVADLHPAALRPETLRAAKLVLLDATGAMLAASGLSGEARPFLDLAAGAGGGPSTILGTDMAASAAMAAFANGALAHALDFEDAFDAAPGHPNASLVPALIALSQDGAPVDGPRFLAALAAGGDLSCRIALALRREMEAGGWYPPPIIAGLGAAIGSAKLLGLDARGIRDALSIALCQSTMPGQIGKSAGTVLRGVREAFPAQAAVLSARLAQAGVAGFEQPLEGPGGFYDLYAEGQFDAADLLDGLGDRFWIEELTFKPWPSCRGTHPFIELALDFLETSAVPLDSIEDIRVGVDSVQDMLVSPLDQKRRPRTVSGAKFSIPLTVGLALSRGRVGIGDFDDAALNDAQALALAARVTAWSRPPGEGPRGSGGALSIVANGREVYSNQLRDTLGSPGKPLSSHEVRAKFIANAGYAARPYSASAAAALADAILSLESCADVGALFIRPVS